MPSMSLLVLAAALLLPGNSLQNTRPDPAASTQQNPSQSAERAPAQQDRTEANRRIRDSINDALSGDVLLSGSHVRADVDDTNITLEGDVRSFEQHQRVLQLVHPFGRWRNIVDKIQEK